MQALAAALLILGGIELTDLHGFLGIGELPTAVSVILTALISVFIINALNLIDGIDGLASGLSGVACAFYTYMFFHAGLYLFSAIAVATLGVLVPFFVYNVFGNAEKQRKIFMGDTGALTIGLLLSAMSCAYASSTRCPRAATRRWWRSPRCSSRASTWCGYTCTAYASDTTHSSPTKTTYTISSLRSG